MPLYTWVCITPVLNTTTNNYPTISTGGSTLATPDAIYTATLRENKPTRLAYSLVPHEGPTALHEDQFQSHTDCIIIYLELAKDLRLQHALVVQFSETKGSGVNTVYFIIYFTLFYFILISFSFLLLF